MSILRRIWRHSSVVTSVTAAAREIFLSDPDTYQLTDIPATRLQFYILNEATMDDAVRAAVNLAVDCEAMAAYLGGTVSPAVGPFSTSAAYGKVTKPAPDAEKAKAWIANGAQPTDTVRVLLKKSNIL